MSETESTVAELFARDPMSLSDQDIDKIVTHLRAQRARYVQGDMTAGRTKPKAPPKPSATSALNLDLDLGDLGL